MGRLKLSKIIDKNISQDLSKHLIKSIILSVFMAISVFMFVMHSDSFLMDISYEYYNYKVNGYFLFGLVEVAFVLLLMFLYSKIKIELIKRFILFSILILFIYINTMISVKLVSYIDLPIQAETKLFLILVYILFFAYITSLISYIIYINYHGNSLCFNKQVAFKIKIKYAVIYMLYGLIPVFVLIAILLLILLFALFKYYVLGLY